ncbi:prostasin [Drosophila simulans]|uniref:Uncharacterized protein, isoform C n=2 Tax=Drosophila simulans TaxID=7240 RepID=A0A0J9RJD4_DROSI|nr:prostasin [Drosophila simulans]KMY95917.1 uncharacterized protein Dsimw501_GD25097, isoform C [Drosophila simulans]
MQTRLAWIAFVFWFLSDVAASIFLEPHCGNYIAPKISGGYNAAFHYSAWMAAINNKTHFICGGTLIHKRFVLTAAHCIRGQDVLSVGLGAYYKSHPEVRRDVIEKIMFDGRSSFENDIGLLKLSSNVIFNAHIRPICIVLNHSLANQMRNVSTFKAFGWGFLRGRKETDILQTITLNNLDRKKCEVDLSVYLSEKQICAGVPFGDTCQGDSGGPLTNNVNISEVGNREVQFGIISAGKITCDGLGMYVDVMSYADWIKTTIERHYTEDEPQSSPVPKIKPQQQDVFLYSDCGGANIAANLEADIYGLNLRAQGIFITHQFVLTNAERLPRNPSNLRVYVKGRTKFYEGYSVLSVLPNDQNDVALLKLNRPVTTRGSPAGMKPICMLANVVDQQRAASTPPFTMFFDAPTHRRIYDVSVALGNPHQCSGRIQRRVEWNKLCVEPPNGMSRIGSGSYILGKKVTNSGKIMLVLFGIVSDSSNGLYVFTNVMNLSEWIANAIRNN